MNTAIISNGRSEGNIGIGFAIPINSVRDLLPQLHTGKVIRGRIGVEVRPIPRDGFEDFGLKSRSGALVGRVVPGGAAARAGIEPGDIIIEFNGRPVSNTSELVNMVTATKPGTSVPLKLVRDRRERTMSVTVDELDLAAEQQGRTSRSNNNQPDQRGTEGFGLTLGDLTPSRSRQLELPSGQTGAVVVDIDPDGPAVGELRPGDVILSVNRQRVSNAAEAQRELQRVTAGRIAQLRVWRDGGEVFAAVRKQ
jgi:serine protease Do